MTAPLYLWAAHPGMTPRPEAWFVTYWSTMPRPLPIAEAQRCFIRLVRAGALLLIRSMPAPAFMPDLFQAAAQRGWA